MNQSVIGTPSAGGNATDLGTHDGDSATRAGSDSKTMDATTKRKPAKKAAPRSSPPAAPESPTGQPEAVQAGLEGSAGEADAAQGPAGAPTPTGNLIDALARRASSIVEQAASILEEEVAAGIVAARQAEDRYVGAGRLRSAETHQLLQRFRKDAHEVVDLLIDLVGVSANMLGNLARNAVTLSGGLPDAANAAAAPGAGGIPMLILPRALKPCETGDVTLTIDNDQDRPTAPFSFLTTGLFSAAGHRIPAHHVVFDPAELTVAAQSTGTVIISVQVPDALPPGEYAGLIQTSALPQARAVLTVHVGQG